jgi:hypothetical protein
MRTLRATLSSLASAAALGGCITPVPGAAQVRITTQAAEVAGCTPVGNVRVPQDEVQSEQDARNQTVGLGGNVLLNTNVLTMNGVAYRCPAAGQAAAPAPH